MQVANKTRRWRSGKALVFDDSFEHQVWNDADEDRIVFVVDSWHPEIATLAQRRMILASAAAGVIQDHNPASGMLEELHSLLAKGHAIPKRFKSELEQQFPGLSL
mmetsp:Transcript_31045/g.51464  ORF Transcript_31045/g.51464 Transcript_31045/m.51464 type:complete len:105 (+) Transcript_31045:156-470(+)